MTYVFDSSINLDFLYDIMTVGTKRLIRRDLNRDFAEMPPAFNSNYEKFAYLYTIFVIP